MARHDLPTGTFLVLKVGWGTCPRGQTEEWEVRKISSVIKCLSARHVGLLRTMLRAF